MEAVHIHLLLNHVPILGSIIGLLLFAYALLRGSDDVRQVAYIALVLTALVAIPVFLTGEPAEEVAEGLPGVSEAFIEQHEDAGKLALWASIATGAIALVAMFFTSRMRGAGRYLVWVTLIASLITAGLMAQTGNLGGQIRHTEIRADAAQQPAQTAEEGSKDRNKKDDDD